MNKEEEKDNLTTQLTDKDPIKKEEKPVKKLSKKTLFFIVIIIAFITVGLSVYWAFQTKIQKLTGKRIMIKEEVSGEKFKVLHIMSYHSPWKWTDDQLQGFKDALSGLDIEYKVFQMDTKKAIKGTNLNRGTAMALIA